MFWRKSSRTSGLSLLFCLPMLDGGQAGCKWAADNVRENLQRGRKSMHFHSSDGLVKQATVK